VEHGGAQGRGGPARLWRRPLGEAGEPASGRAAGQARGGGGARVAAGARGEGRWGGRGVEAGRARRGLASGARARSRQGKQYSCAGWEKFWF
jgi:hypothetical protein